MTMTPGLSPAARRWANRITAQLNAGLGKPLVKVADVGHWMEWQRSAAAFHDLATACTDRDWAEVERLLILYGYRKS